LDYNWLTPKAQMRVTPGKGSGSFVVSKISKGEMVASFGGNVINQIELIKINNSQKNKNKNIVKKNYKIFIDYSKRKNHDIPFFIKQ
jgi:hypothetical protein